MASTQKDKAAPVGPASVAAGPGVPPSAEPVRTEAQEAARRVDEACVERALAGDKTAFEEIYERHREPVFKVAFGVVRNVDDALDVAQETFLKAYRCLERFEKRSSLLTWLCQIAIHRAIDMTRRKKVRKASELEDYMTGDGSRNGTSNRLGPKPTLDPGALAQGGELKAALDRALDELSEKHREVFVLYTVKGLAYKDIAKTLGIQIGTVMSRLFYARKRLQELLSGFQDGQVGGAA